MIRGAGQHPDSREASCRSEGGSRERKYGHFAPAIFAISLRYNYQKRILLDLIKSKSPSRDAHRRTTAARSRSASCQIGGDDARENDTVEGPGPPDAGHTDGALFDLL